MRNTFSLVQNLGACFLLVSQLHSLQWSILRRHKKPHQGFDVQEFRVGVGLSGERWAEDAIATVYGKNGKMFPTFSLSYRFTRTSPSMHRQVLLD